MQLAHESKHGHPADAEEPRRSTGSGVEGSAEARHAAGEGGPSNSGADLLRGVLRYDEGSASWRLGDVNLAPYLARYRDQSVMVVIAPLGRAEEQAEDPIDEHRVCAICGCALDDVGDCPHCQLHFVQTAQRLRKRVQCEVLFQEIDRIVEQSWGG